MSDVTFGVKITPQMKEELTGMIKDSELSGKAFMSLMMQAYKLEKNKGEVLLGETDVDELQKLLGRVQGLFLNLHQRADVLLIEQQKDFELNYTEAKKEVEDLQKICEDLKEQIEVISAEKMELKKGVDTFEKSVKKLETEFKDVSLQLKKERELNEKYVKDTKINVELETQNIHLKEQLNTKDEDVRKLEKTVSSQSSEMWFVEKENEKLKEEITKLQEEAQNTQKTLEEKFALQLKNTSLELKLELHDKIAILKDDYDKQISNYQQKIAELEKN
ncbi:MAG: hypothetical protein ATN36_05750 [Epulopiscium sp. Nele67-Bin005]|nr:MAG: hypothetical protein ATN36_05750 [Epulopiscium sp. Nele67-Bin005]